MRRALLWTFTIVSLLFWGLALVMALLEVVHLAHGQSTDHAAGYFAVQSLVVASVFTASALVARRSREAA
jgi:succinate-acetate transporter protein